MYEVKEQDWKRFRRKLPDWQESYMAKLNREYIRLLSGEGSAADKFWALENRIRQDKKSIGVSAEMRRSQIRSAPKWRNGHFGLTKGNLLLLQRK